MADANLIEQLKEHMRFEPGVMDDKTLELYVDYATKYVMFKTGRKIDYLIIMVANAMYDHRSSDESFKLALKALEPVFALEVLTHEDDNQQA